MQKDAYARAVASGLLALVTAFLFLLDAFTKHLFFGNAERWTGFFPSGTRLFAITRYLNTGGTFSLPVPTWILVGLSTTFLVWLLVILFHAPRWWQHRWGALFAGCLFGGALGNLVDRVRLGYVRDWLLVNQRSALNLADILIVIGCLGLVWIFSRHPARQPQ